MPSSRPASPSSLPLFAGVTVFVIGTVVAHAETLDDARLRQLAGQAATYAGDVRSLLAKGADPNIPDHGGRTAVHGAARIGALETMEALLRAGGDPNRRDEDGNTPLHFASDTFRSLVMVPQSIATIRVLLSARADPSIANAAGGTPLHLAAASHDEPGGVVALLGRGADPNRKDRGGDTPLHAAVGSGWSSVLRALLDGGADPRLTNGDGLTVLQLFVWDSADHGPTAEMLVAAGADPDRKYPNGDALLHATIRRGGSQGKFKVAEALLAAGADPCIRDVRGFTPYSVAAEGSAIHRILDRAGGYELACDRQREPVALDSGERRRIQDALASAGFDPGPADGKFGPRTRRAIEGWQQANGYTATGELTSSQVEALLADAGPLEPFGPNWILAENQPCQLYTPTPEQGETVTWSGGCVDGKASGMGRAVWRGSSYGQGIYEGEYRAGKEHDDNGLYTVDGYSYEGRWRAGVPHGYGILTDPEGNRFEGEWRNGCFEQDGWQLWYGSKEHCGFE